MADYPLFSPSRKKGKHSPFFFLNNFFSLRKCNIYVTHFTRVHEEKIFHSLVGKRFKSNRGKKEYHISDSKLFYWKRIDKFLVFGTQSFGFSWIFSFHIRVFPATNPPLTSLEVTRRQEKIFYSLSQKCLERYQC